MKVALTGATGFLGKYIVDELSRAGHELKAWFRSDQSRLQFSNCDNIEWIKGELHHRESTNELVQGCDAVVHSALFRPGAGFRGAEGNLLKFCEINLLGSLELMEAAIEAQTERFVFISTCAVHEIILTDRPLDESHPLWATHHYGAHKAALEKFVHSFGLGQGYEICALRPTGIYGKNTPVEKSKWFDLIQAVARGEEVEARGGGKEVHAADVARSIQILLTTADSIAGQAFNCYDRYISDFDVAKITKKVTDSNARIIGQQKKPKNEIDTRKIETLGMTFGGSPRLEQTVQEILTFL